MTTPATPKYPLGREAGRVFAAFAVVRVGSQIWATTRDGGAIGLPGGKREAGDDGVTTARRCAAEGGLHLCGAGRLIRTALVEGRVVQWVEFDAALPLRQWKEQRSGTRPVLASTEAVANSGYGNDFLIKD